MEKKIEPDITFVIPAYNGTLFLRETIKSIQNQNSVFTETIVVDDCSDSTLSSQLTNDFPNVLFLRNKTNMGQSFSRNRGAKIATANIICFLDSDDTIDFNFSKNMIEHVNIRNTPIVCLSSVILENKSILSFIINELRNIVLLFLYHFNSKKLPINFFFATSPSRMVFPKYVTNKYTFDDKLRQCEDWELSIKILKELPIYICPKKLLNFRFSKNSQTNLQIKKNGVECYTRIVGSLPKKYQSTLPIMFFKAYIKLLKNIK